MFEKVETGEVDFGFVRIEDWSKGTVVGAMDQLLRRNVLIEAEFICQRDLVSANVSLDY